MGRQLSQKPKIQATTTLSLEEAELMDWYCRTTQVSRSALLRLALREFLLARWRTRAA